MIQSFSGRPPVACARMCSLGARNDTWTAEGRNFSSGLRNSFFIRNSKEFSGRIISTVQFNRSCCDPSRPHLARTSWGAKPT